MMNDTGRSMTNLLFTLLLLCAFAVMALIVVMTGADAYEKISSDMAANSEIRIPLSYVASKVRQADEQGLVSVVEKENTEALVIESRDGEIANQTWIYTYEGYLYEVTVEKGTEFTLKDGMAILPVLGFHVNIDGSGLLAVKAADRNGRELELRLDLRSGGYSDKYAGSLQGDGQI